MAIGAGLHNAWRADYDDPVPSSEWSDTGWRSLPVSDVGRALDDIKGARPLPDDVLRSVARAFQVREHAPTRLEIDRRRFGSFTIVAIGMSEMRVRELPFARANTVHVAFVIEGAVTMTARDGGTVVLGPGDVSLISNWSLFDVACRAGTRVLHILVPESLLRERGVRVRPARFRLEGPRSLAGVLLSFSRSLVDPAWSPSAAAARAAERALEELLIGFLIESEDAHLDRQDLRAQLRRRALEEVAARHHDPGLTPTQLATVLGVSLRHLQRGFEGTGVTLAQHITRQRLRSAEILLSAPGADALTVAQVARSAGFTSPFELRSAFRAEFGMLPSEYRSSRARLTPEAGHFDDSAAESPDRPAIVDSSHPSADP